MLVWQQFEIFVQRPVKQANMSEEDNCWAATSTQCCCSDDAGILPGCDTLQRNVTASPSEKQMMTSSSPKQNVVPSRDSKSTGNTRIQMSLLERCSRKSFCQHCLSLPRIPPHTPLPFPKRTLTHRITHFLHLSVTQWVLKLLQERQRMLLHENCPSTQALGTLCYRFKVLQEEQGSLWPSNGSSIPNLRSHIISEAAFMPSLPLSQMQFPVPLCIRLHHSTCGDVI